MPEERALIGVEEIAKFYSWSIAKTKKELPKMKQAGVVKRVLIGRGHNRSVRIIALRSLLERYWIECINNY
jgi:hypothetical protein